MHACATYSKITLDAGRSSALLADQPATDIKFSSHTGFILVERSAINRERAPSLCRSAGPA